MNLDVTLICRICLQSERLFHSILEEFNSEPLLEIVKLITNISISIEDHLPQQICHDCTIKLLQACDLRRKAEESDRYLREERTTYPCNVCQKSFRTRILLHRHEKYHSLERIKCPLCPRSFAQKSNLKRHLMTHQESGNLQCDRCSEQFHSLQTLYEHFKTHENIIESNADGYIIHCELCNDCSTASYVVFRKHMREQHNFLGKIRPFVCRICDMRFTSKQGMLRHIDNIHENNRRNLRKRDKNFLCTICGKSFYTNFHLEVHGRSHTGQRPFHCRHPGCSKAFSQLSGLKMHSYTHSGEKPFSCHICGKSFSQYGHVREHIRIHLDSKPYVCRICQHSFRKKGNLTAHMMIHSERKPHICPICRKQFIQSPKLRKHMERKHSNSKF